MMESALNSASLLGLGNLCTLTVLIELLLDIVISFIKLQAGSTILFSISDTRHKLLLESWKGRLI